MFKKRDSSIPYAFEFALFLLAIFVFSWGLHAKLVLYRSNHGTFSITNSMAKLSTESPGAWTADSLRNQVPLAPSSEPHHFIPIDLSVLDQSVLKAQVHVESRPRAAGQYYLHGPNLKRRPPPACV